MLYIFLSLLGIIGGILSGMVGIGGAIIIYPALLIIPPMLGLLLTMLISLQDLHLRKYFLVL